MSNDDYRRDGANPPEDPTEGLEGRLQDRVEEVLGHNPLSLFPDDQGRDDAELDQAVGRGEGAGEAKEVEGLSQSQIVWSRFIRHRGAIFGMVTIFLIALLSYTAMGIGSIPGWWKYQSHTETSPIVNGGAPTLSWSGLGEHPFGQDNIGRDNFAMVLSGVQTSLLVMVVLGMMALILGTLVGRMAGYYRGKTDTFLMRFTDLVITLPVIVLGRGAGQVGQHAAAEPEHDRGADRGVEGEHAAAAGHLPRADSLAGPRPAGAQRVPDPAGARVRGRRPGLRAPATAGSSPSTCCPTRSA